MAYLKWPDMYFPPINLWTMPTMKNDIKTIDIDHTLAERGNRYGSFTGHAAITQGIKTAMITSNNWLTLADDQREALEMVAHKIGRILNGDPDYHDSWHDIIGYTKLVADRLEQEQALTKTH